MIEPALRTTVHGLLYRALHHYPHLSRRLVFALLGAPERFVDHRGWLMSIDALLSAVRLTGARPGWVAAGMLAPLTLGGSLLATALWSSLLRRLDELERRQALRNLLRKMEAGRVNTGSARMLRGHITVGHTFLRSRPGRRWTQARRNRARQRAQRAMEWLQEQAAEHGVTLQFHELELDDIESSVIKRAGSRPSTRVLLDGSMPLSGALLPLQS
jgi:hypothetical protein